MHEQILVVCGMGGVEDGLGRAKSTSWRNKKAKFRSEQILVLPFRTDPNRHPTPRIQLSVRPLVR